MVVIPSISIDDYVITSFNAGQTQTFPLFIFGATRQGVPPEVNVLATMLLLVVLGLMAANVLAQRARTRRDTRVSADDVYREGITKVTPADFVSARALGRTIKLLSICERITTDDGQQRISARVYPAPPVRSGFGAIRGLTFLRGQSNDGNHADRGSRLARLLAECPVDGRAPNSQCLCDGRRADALLLERPHL